MAIGTDLFDRCIDVKIYDANKGLIAKVTTPLYGSKPEIKVEGTILSNTFQISGKVTITNLERSVPVEQAEFLDVTMYYGGAKTSQALRKHILYHVQFADQSKQPPNRQVCFNCFVAGTTPDIMNTLATIGKVDSDNKPVEQSLKQVLKEVIGVYNDTIQKTEPAWSKELRLSADPELRMTASTQAAFEQLTVSAQWTNTPICSILDSLMLITKEVEPTTKDGKTNKIYLAFNYYIENNKLVVAELPSNRFIAITSKEQLELNYVLSAYRYGPQVHVRALFDPRIHQDSIISINGSALSGKRVAGDLIPLLKGVAGNNILFKPVGGIQFAFSTTEENWMQMQGTMYV